MTRVKVLYWVWRRKKLGGQIEKLLPQNNSQLTHFTVHLLIGNFSFSINCFFIGWIKTRQDSKHLLIFLFTMIDCILIPIVSSFSPTSWVTTWSLQSAWQSAVTRIFSTTSFSLAFSFSKLSSEQNSSFRVSTSSVVSQTIQTGHRH